MVTKYGEEAGQALAPYAGRTNLTPAEAREIVMTMFPGAPEIEVKKAVWICVQKRLNPLMKHLFLVGYNNKAGGKSWAIIMAIKSERIRAMRAGGITYLDDSPRFMTEAEQMKIRGVVDTVNDWYICKGRNSRGMEASGYGCWPKNLRPQGDDKGNTGSNMGMIRAERQMIDRLCPEEDDGDTGVTDGRYASVRGQIIDLGTGEVMDAAKGSALPETPQSPPAVEGQVTGQPAGDAPTDSQSDATASQPPLSEPVADPEVLRQKLYKLWGRNATTERQKFIQTFEVDPQIASAVVLQKALDAAAKK